MSIENSNHNEVDEEHLNDAYLSSFIIGAVILAIWLVVFIIYLKRL